MKKLMTIIVSVLAIATVASAVTVTADVAYRTKVFSKGTVAFENTIVAGAELEAYGFVAGINTFNPVEARTVTTGKVSTVASSGLLKRVDTTLGYRFTSPLADLTVGGIYESYSKSAQSDGHTSNTELFARLNGGIGGTLLVWDATTTLDTKNRTNNIEANVRCPFGFKWVKIAPTVGLGFNDPGTATIAGLRDSKRYVNLGVGVGYYSKKADIYAEYLQRRDAFLSSGGEVDSVAAGVRLRF